MTLNEQICKVMNWNYKLPETKHRLASDSMGVAKLLQARMQKDGLRIEIYAYSTCFFEAAAFKPGRELVAISDTLDTEPAALVALFAKVYNLEGK